MSSKLHITMKWAFVLIMTLVGAADKTIWFTATGNEERLAPTARCGVLTACAMNPGYEVVVMSFVPLDVADLTPYCSNRLRVLVTTPEVAALADTPLLAWYFTAKATQGKFFKADLSDALRSAIMYKHGGVYFDLDMISLTSVADLPVNSLGQQLNGPDKRGIVPFLNGAGMIFDRETPFMRRVMNDFPAAWDAKVFGTVGPNLLWDTYESIRLESIHNGTVSAGAQLPRDVLPVVLAKNVYYPIKFKAAMLRNFFTRPAPRLPWYPSDTVAVHLWSQLISKMQVLPTSRGGAIIANCTDIAWLRKTRQGA